MLIISRFLIKLCFCIKLFLFRVNHFVLYFNYCVFNSCLVIVLSYFQLSYVLLLYFIIFFVMFIVFLSCHFIVIFLLLYFYLQHCHVRLSFFLLSCFSYLSSFLFVVFLLSYFIVHYCFYYYFIFLILIGSWLDDHLRTRAHLSPIQAERPFQQTSPSKIGQPRGPASWLQTEQACTASPASLLPPSLVLLACTGPIRLQMVHCARVSYSDLQSRWHGIS